MRKTFGIMMLTAAVALPAASQEAGWLARETVLEYQMQARYPEHSRAIRVGEADPVKEKRTATKQTSRGPEGRGPALSVWGGAVSYEVGRKQRRPDSRLSSNLHRASIWYWRPATTRSSRGPLASLGIRNYRLFFIGQAISTTGVWMQRLALICPDLSSASEFGLFSQTAFRLAQRIFPGPYTLVVPANRIVSSAAQVPPPGERPTTMRIGFVGKPWPHAAVQPKRSAAAQHAVLSRLKR